MNDSKNKGGRPRKGKVGHVSVPPSDPVFPALARRRLSKLSVDPTWTENLSELGFADLIAGAPDFARTKEITGIYMTHVLRNAPIDAVEEFFHRLVLMRREHDKQSQDKHRHWHVLKGYLDYLSETENRQPSKPELKEYLIARKSIYKNLPDEADKPGWTDAWKGAGLNELTDRKVRRKP